jgi:hypothetical protein
VVNHPRIDHWRNVLPDDPIVVKVFVDRPTLSPRLAALGWRVDDRATPSFFLDGTAQLV